MRKAVIPAQAGIQVLLIASLSASPPAHAASSTAPASAYPDRPIRIIVAFPPGASTDIVARLVSGRLAESWGQNVVVENRPGAGGNIGAHTALRANPDGYTVLMNSSAMAVNVSLYRQPGYRITDFVPVLQGPTTPNLISVHPSVKATTLKELIASARAAPMNYGSSGTGTTPHLDMELLFRTLSKVDITHVPYGPAQAVTAVVGKQVPIASTSLPPAVPHLQAGRIRSIAVTTAKRSPIVPETPTVAESGFPGFDDHTWFSFFAPAGTPPAIVNKLNAEVTRILQSPEVKARLDVLSLEFTPNSPAEFAARLKAEVQRYAKMVKDSGARAD
ncbi:MAG TPA: tripartite tricarboxylate transporter substrate binding protein [Burkholderiales bacterium]|nr:tripartite tricarboxylate transporter substrate binding protein [Burkholderiales bacterium]